MEFAGRWLVGTVAVLALVLLVSFLLPIKKETSALAPFVYELFDGEPITREAPEKTRDPIAADLKRRVQKVHVARNRCREYYDQSMLWRVVKREYPRDLQVMEAPLRPGETVYVEVVNDPWGNPYYLEVDGRKLRVWSWGPDAQEGTDDDISYPKDD